ncbi:MAG: hypothetical protein ACYDAD_14965 [Acidimicrobiales bacterium]
MTSYLWPNEDGWPYPDQEEGPVVLETEGIDEDEASLRWAPDRVLSRLDPLERTVIMSRYGLCGAPMRSMKQLHAELGLPREDLRLALGSGLAKLRTELAGT